jgi:hypothetical protein
MSTDVTISKLDPPATTAVEAADQTRKPSWAGRLWDTFDLPPAERWLLFKVDASLLVFASVRFVPPARAARLAIAHPSNASARS